MLQFCFHRNSPLFEDRGDAEGRKRGIFFACKGNFPMIIGTIMLDWLYMKKGGSLNEP